MTANLGRLARLVCRLLVFFVLFFIALFFFFHESLAHSDLTDYSSQPTYIINVEQSII